MRLVTDDRAETVTVGVGVIGSTWTEITSGLEAGQVVVIADLDEVLPGSATATSSGDDDATDGDGPTGIVPGGFGGGGFPAGGLPTGMRPPG